MQLILAPVFAHLLPVSSSQSHAAVRSLYCMYPRNNNVSAFSMSFHSFFVKQG